MELKGFYYKIFLLTFLSVIYHPAFSQIVREVNDVKTIEQVTRNTLYITAAEGAQNNLLDTISNIQNEIEFKTASIYSYKQMAMATLTNTKGFDAESMYYKEIASTALKIGDVSVDVLNTIKNSSWAGKANAIIYVSQLVSKSTQLVNDFVNIVTNLSVEHPLKSKNVDGIEKKQDDKNLLDRYERMNMASQINYDLKLIYNRLYRIKFLLSYGNLNDIFYQLDRQTWASILNGKATTEKLIKQWNNLKK